MEKLNTNTATREELINFLKGCKASPGKELGLRGYVERINGKEVVILFNRAKQAKGSNFLEKAIDRFWNWFDRDAQRKLAREGLEKVLNTHANGAGILAKLEQGADASRSIKPSKLHNAINYDSVMRAMSLTRSELKEKVKGKITEEHFNDLQEKLSGLSRNGEALVNSDSWHHHDQECTLAFVMYLSTALSGLKGSATGQDPATLEEVVKFTRLWSADQDNGHKRDRAKRDNDMFQVIDAAVGILKEKLGAEKMDLQQAGTILAPLAKDLKKNEDEKRVQLEKNQGGRSLRIRGKLDELRFINDLEMQLNRKLAKEDRAHLVAMDTLYKNCINESKNQQFQEIGVECVQEFFKFAQNIWQVGKEGPNARDLEKVNFERVQKFAAQWREARDANPQTPLPLLIGELVNAMAEVAAHYELVPSGKAKDASAQRDQHKLQGTVPSTTRKSVMRERTPKGERPGGSRMDKEYRVKDERDLTSKFYYAGFHLFESNAFKAWLNFSPDKGRIEECCKDFAKFARAIHDGQDPVCDIGLLREFARFWTETGRHNPARIDDKVFEFYLPAIGQLVERINGIPGGSDVTPDRFSVFVQHVRDFFAKGGAEKSLSAPMPDQPEKPVQPNAASARPSFPDSEDIENAFNGRDKITTVRQECLNAFREFVLRFNSTIDEDRKGIELDKKLLQEFAVEWKKAREKENHRQLRHMQEGFPLYQVDLLVDMVERIPKDKHTKLRNFYRQEAADYQRKLEEAARRSLYL